MLGDISIADNIYIVTGYTDMRKSIDGLCAIILKQLQTEPDRNAIYLFCGKRCDRIKVLLREPDGILSLLGDNGFCDLGEGTLYPLLTRLNKNEYIFCRKAKSPLGPIRKYYTITLKGEDIEEFCKSYFEEEAEKTSKWIGGCEIYLQYCLVGRDCRIIVGSL